MTTITRVHRSGINDVWDKLHDADPLASPFQSRRWARTMRSLGWWRDTAIAVSFSDGVDAVLPGMTYRVVPSRWAPRLSWPRYWGEATPLWNAPPERVHIRLLLDLLARERSVLTRLSTGPTNGQAFTDVEPGDWQRVLRRSHVIDLSQGFEAVHAGFSKSIRYEQRRALRRGVEVRSSTSGALVEPLLEVFDKAIPRWAGKQHEPPLLTRLRAHRRDSARKVRAIVREMGRDCLLTLATHQGRPVGTSLALRGRNPEALLAPVDPDVGLKLGASQVIYTDVVEDLCADGSGVFNLGESGFDGGLAQYKERYGAVPVDHVDLHRERVPLSAVERVTKDAVKRVIGFED